MVSNHLNSYPVYKKKRGLLHPLIFYCTESVVVETFVVSTLVVSVTTAVESVAVVDSVDSDPQDTTVNIEATIASVMRILFMSTILNKK
jgi:hypothetical protein